MTDELPKKYDPEIEEPKLQMFWEENRINGFDPDNTDKPIFSIEHPAIDEAVIPWFHVIVNLTFDCCIK